LCRSLLIFVSIDAPHATINHYHSWEWDKQPSITRRLDWGDSNETALQIILSHGHIWICYTATIAMMMATKTAMSMAERTRTKLMMEMAIIRTQELMKMFTVKVAVDMIVATMMLAESNTQLKYHQL